MSGEKGFSLMEVITATVVLSLLAVGIFSTTSFTKRMEITAEQRLIAMAKVEEELNLLKQQSISALNPTNTTLSGTCSALCVSNVCKCFPYELNSTMSIAVSTIIALSPSDPRTREVAVRADWIDVLGNHRTESAAMYVQA